MTTYLSCAETAKMIRESLKQSFPKTRFGVRSSTYAGGASISIRWTDGPNDAQVGAVVGHMRGSYFDGSIDYQGSISHMLDGKAVHLGADYLHFNRSDSPAAVERAIDKVFRKFAGNFAESNVGKPTVEQYSKGDLWSVHLKGRHDWNGGNLQNDVAEVLAKYSFVLKVLPSTTAARIFVTHDDGYSKSNGAGMSVVRVDE